jgi:8-oxo-dGTP pyrophosphatase MutT (NUDIX family)
MLDLDPDRPPVVPRDAATVVVLRQGRGAVELFCVKRHARSGFLGGAVVFPGGKVDPTDGHGQWADLSSPLAPRARELADSVEVARTFAVAALRELLEEAAILPVVGARLDARAALSLRAELGENAASSAFAELLRRHDLTVDTARLEALWRWVTPAAESRRYDTRFYVMPLPEGQTGQHDQHETTSSFWATPRDILDRWERGEIFMAPPTVRTAEIFLDADSVEAALGIARAQSLEPVCPFFTMENDRAVLALPGDPLYPEPAPVPGDPAAPTRFELVDNRFVGRRVES